MDDMASGVFERQTVHISTRLPFAQDGMARYCQRGEDVVGSCVGMEAVRRRGGAHAHRDEAGGNACCEEGAL